MSDNVYRYQRQNSTLPNVVFALLIANGLAYAMQVLYPNIVEGLFVLLSPNTGGFWPWQLLTYGFLHSRDSLYHIFFNMLALWMFGREIENLMGSRRFGIFWVVSPMDSKL